MCSVRPRTGSGISVVRALQRTCALSLCPLVSVASVLHRGFLTASVGGQGDTGIRSWPAVTSVRWRWGFRGEPTIWTGSCFAKKSKGGHSSIYACLLCFFPLNSEILVLNHFKSHCYVPFYLIYLALWNMRRYRNLIVKLHLLSQSMHSFIVVVTCNF